VTVPDQAINELSQDSMYFQDVKNQIAYKLTTLKRTSSPSKGSPVTHTFLRQKLKKREKGY